MIASSEARATSFAAGYRKQTLSNSMSGAAPSLPHVRGSATAPGRSATSGFRSSTSKTRSKLTSAVITCTCTLVSWPIGAYTRISRVLSATRVPSWKAPRITRLPPTP